MKTFVSKEIFVLENKSLLPGLEIAYHTYGRLNAQRDNVVWVCHALTANSDVFDWWSGLFGTNAFFNPEEHFIVCANNLGSCYGSTGPLSINPHTGGPWFSYFPQISIRDQVQAHELLRQHLGIEKIKLLIGGSQGAQQVLEWSIQQPGVAENIVAIATNARHSPWGIAFNESQRLAIKADRTYYANTPDGGQKGLAAARSMALLSYRNYNTYNQTQKDHNEWPYDHNASSYQRYQGQKLVNRFNAYSYVALSQAMDSHHVGRGRNSAEEALGSIKARALVIGISSDILFPPAEQQFIAAHIPGSQLAIIDSFYGHDGFLIETQQLTALVKNFLETPHKKQIFKQHNLIHL